MNVTPYPLAPALKDEIPEIIEATRYVWAGGKLLRYGEISFFENNIRAVDPSFLQMYSFPLVRGNKETALETPYSLLLSEDIAEKYFGNENPMGQIISVNNQYDFTVTGVLKNTPHNTILQFDILIPYEFLKKTGQTNESFGSNSIQTFVRLQENADVNQVNT